MNHFVISAFIVFVFTLFASFYFVLRGREKTERLFGLFWFCVAFWTFFVGLQFELLKWMTGFLWGWLLHVGCIFVPMLFFHFTLYLTGTRSRFSWALRLAFLLGCSFLLLIPFTNLFTQEIVYRDHYAYPKPRVLYPIYIFFFQLIGVSTWFLLFRWAQKLGSSIRKMLYLFLFLHTLAYIGAMDNYLVMYDIRIFPLYPYGLYLILPYVIFGSYAMNKVMARSQVS